MEEEIEMLIRQNEELRNANNRINEYNNFLNNENEYLKKLIDKILDNKKEGMKNDSKSLL